MGPGGNPARSPRAIPYRTSTVPSSPVWPLAQDRETYCAPSRRRDWQGPRPYVTEDSRHQRDAVLRADGGGRAVPDRGVDEARSYRPNRSTDRSGCTALRRTASGDGTPEPRRCPVSPCIVERIRESARGKMSRLRSCAASGVSTGADRTGQLPDLARESRRTPGHRIAAPAAGREQEDGRRQAARGTDSHAGPVERMNMFHIHCLTPVPAAALQETEPTATRRPESSGFARPAARRCHPRPCRPPRTSPGA